MLGIDIIHIIRAPALLLSPLDPQAPILNWTFTRAFAHFIVASTAFIYELRSLKFSLPLIYVSIFESSVIIYWLNVSASCLYLHHVKAKVSGQLSLVSTSDLR